MQKVRSKLSFFATILIVIGAMLIAGSFGINYMQYRAKQKQIEAFDKAREKAKKNSSGENTSDDADADAGKKEKKAGAELPEGVLCVLRIPRIDSADPVKEGVTKSALAASLGHEPDTVLPGTVGNCVIAGHRNYTFGKFFNRLDEMEVGDLLYVDTLSDTFAYRVKAVKVVEPTEVSILENTPNEQLTLYTCTPIYIATHRLVIIAERIYE